MTPAPDPTTAKWEQAQKAIEEARELVNRAAELIAKLIAIPKPY